MPCQILVSNKSGIATGEIVTVVDGNHVWTKNESMQAFLGAGGLFEDWSRQFSLVIVDDKSMGELLYLQDYNDIGERKWFFIEPEQSTTEWQDLYLTGQVSRDWSIISQFIGER